MKKLLVILTLALTLSLCAAALAEQEEAAGTIPRSAAEAAPETEQEVLAQALEAYRALKGEDKAKDPEALQKELETFVQEEKLTREQAELILKYYTEQLAARGPKKQAGAKRGTQEGAEEKTNRPGTRKNGKGQKTQKNIEGKRTQKSAEGQTLRQKPGGRNMNPPQTETGTDDGPASPEADTTSGATRK